MNKKQLDKLEQEISKTHVVFKRNTKINSITKNTISFAKGLSPEQTGLLLVKLLVGLSSIVHRKQLSKLLIDSNVPNMGIDVNSLLEELYLSEEKPLKIRDFLKEV